MLTMTSALLVGPYDWRPELISRAQYETRLAALRAAMARHNAGAVIVHGSALDDAALVWLTGLVPKLGPAFAFVPASGDIRLLFAGGPGMQPSAARQTWIEDVRALRGVEADLMSCLNDMDCGSDLGVALWDGESLSETSRLAIARAAQGRRRLTEAGAEFDALRRSKTDLERALVGQAAVMAAEVLRAFEEALSAGSDLCRSGIVAERAGNACGAQDVRVLGSRRPGGMPLLLEPTHDMQLAATNVYVAVRHAGYWADLYGEAGEATELARRAQAALRAALAHIKPGLALDDLRELADGQPNVRAHLSGIGAQLKEAPKIDEGDRLEEGDVCSLWMEARDEDRFGFASAVIVVEREGVTILSPPAREIST